MSMEQFTLDEAKQYLGHTVIAKTDVDTGHAWVMAKEHGTVVGIDGGYTERAELAFCLAVQFWPERESAHPTVLFFDKQMFNEYFSLSTEEKAAS